MNHIEFTTPAPSCLIPLTHPARGYCPDNVDVSRTFAEHSTIDLLDDYGRVDRDDWLSPGGFR